MGQSVAMTPVVVAAAAAAAVVVVVWSKYCDGMLR